MSTTIQQNNTNLQSVLDTINALEPNSGGGVPDTCTIEIYDPGLYGINNMYFTQFYIDSDGNNKIETICTWEMTPSDYEDVYFVRIHDVVCGSVVYIQGIYGGHDNYQDANNVTVLFSAIGSSSNIELAFTAPTTANTIGSITITNSIDAGS